MNALMQDRPLLISSLIRHAAAHHGDTEIVSARAEETPFRYDYRSCESRAKRVALALGRLGIRRGDRVATLAWNHHRHLELYYGISGSGAICHTVNPRLFYEQIRFICRHAEDRVLFFDLSFIDLVQRLAPEVPSIQCWVALCSPEQLPPGLTLPGLQCYESLLDTVDGDYEWPLFDENTASSLCYTSGTTGDPKGILYSHRSTILHTITAATPDCFDISATDVVMPASSMYHANAWGVPYVATMAGSKLVLPGQQLDGRSLHQLIDSEGVTHSFGVPTIWLGLVQFLEQQGLAIRSLRQLVIGGAACPLALIKTLAERHGVETVQLWGMTETSPLGVVNRFKRKHEGLPKAQLDELLSKQGRVVYGCELEIVDDDGRLLPHDGKAFGELLIRGPWIASGYYRSDKNVLRGAGWFPTGDVATVDADGYMRITDRAKDVIKSGGEWVSSIDLENEAVGHPAVAEAAVIGVPHPKWDERPLLIVVPKPGGNLSREAMLDFLRPRVAKWWLPDDVIFVDEIPHTATGKILKTELRSRYAAHLMGG